MRRHVIAQPRPGDPAARLGYNSPMDCEIDLHGCTVVEALARFTRAYNAHVAAGKTGDVRVIHGHGASGGTSKIRTRLREMLSRYGDRLSFQRGEDWIDGNPGLTIVLPVRPLPEPLEQLGDAIAAFCASPRTRDKIVAEFREHGEPDTLGALKLLVRRGRLETFRRGRHERYSAAASPPATARSTTDASL